MVSTLLGKVAVVPKGEFSPTVTYNRLDILSYEGTSYLALKTCIGVTPPNAEFYAVLAGVGPQGDPGSIGPAGPQGEIGPAGETGPAGPQGPQGEQGPAGPQGEQGPAGPQGEKGDPGPQGEQGEKGDPGPQGNGLTVLGTYDSVSALESAVLSASQGDTYQVGTIAPYTLYMWDETDGTPGFISLGQLQGPTGATGPQGPQGEQGPQGPQGEQGEKGDPGVTGPQGEQGPEGPEGPEGPQGEIGPEGPQGEIGPEGPQGPQGEVGPQGEQGIQGETGPQGPAGPNEITETTASNLNGLLKADGSVVSVAQIGDNFAQQVGAVPSAGGDMTGPLGLYAYKEALTTLTGTEIDPTTGGVFLASIAADTTFTFAGTMTEGYAYSVVLLLAFGETLYTVGLPDSVAWVGTAPTFEAGKTYEITLRTYDGGTVWYASCGGGV